MAGTVPAGRTCAGTLWMGVALVTVGVAANAAVERAEAAPTLVAVMQHAGDGVEDEVWMGLAAAAAAVSTLIPGESGGVLVQMVGALACLVTLQMFLRMVSRSHKGNVDAEPEAESAPPREPAGDALEHHETVKAHKDQRSRGNRAGRRHSRTESKHKVVPGMSAEAAAAAAAATCGTSRDVENKSKVARTPTARRKNERRTRDTDPWLRGMLERVGCPPSLRRQRRPRRADGSARPSWRVFQFLEPQDVTNLYIAAPGFWQDLTNCIDLTNHEELDDDDEQARASHLSAALEVLRDKIGREKLQALSPQDQTLLCHTCVESALAVDSPSFAARFVDLLSSMLPFSRLIDGNARLLEAVCQSLADSPATVHLAEKCMRKWLALTQSDPQASAWFSPSFCVQVCYSMLVTSWPKTNATLRDNSFSSSSALLGKLAGPVGELRKETSERVDGLVDFCERSIAAFHGEGSTLFTTPGTFNLHALLQQEAQLPSQSARFIEATSARDVATTTPCPRPKANSVEVSTSAPSTSKPRRRNRRSKNKKQLQQQQQQQAPSPASRPSSNLQGSGKAWSSTGSVSSGATAGGAPDQNWGINAKNKNLNKSNVNGNQATGRSRFHSEGSVFGRRNLALSTSSSPSSPASGVMPTVAKSASTREKPTSGRRITQQQQQQQQTARRNRSNSSQHQLAGNASGSKSLKKKRKSVTAKKKKKHENLHATVPAVTSTASNNPPATRRPENVVTGGPPANTQGASQGFVQHHHTPVVTSPLLASPRQTIGFASPYCQPRQVTPRTSSSSVGWDSFDSPEFALSPASSASTASTEARASFQTTSVSSHHQQQQQGFLPAQMVPALQLSPVSPGVGREDHRALSKHDAFDDELSQTTVDLSFLNA
ncbi:TBC1 domain family member 2A [Durusdinium trenchii]|uniref:TBC1 domain family member 2A n=1 Tax=Durusdinium trenchii TaxID=1381693 RepID=A0ABP0LJ87_9DINO